MLYLNLSRLLLASVLEFMQKWGVAVSVLVVIIDVISQNIFFFLHFFDKTGKNSLHVIQIAYLETLNMKTNIKKSKGNT